MNINILFGAFILLFNTPSGATIITVSNTDTALDNGKYADLQGLEWLSLDETAGRSRLTIEAGFGGFLADGWEYATRQQTETLLSSLWGGVYDGWSKDNGVGANWFGDIFGGLGFSSDYNSLFKTRYNYSYFLFGTRGECLNLPENICYGHVAWMDNYAPEFTAYNTITNVIETSYQHNDGRVGYFNDYWGANMGVRSDNASIKDSSSGYVVGSLLVRSTSVPEPSILALFSVGLVGIGFLRRRRLCK